MSKIVGVGSSIVDITGFAPHLPVAGETVMGSNLRLGPGGKGSNQMTAARRAGCDVVMISRLGDDALSAICLKHFAENGIPTTYIPRAKGEITAGALIEIDTKDAQNRIIVVCGANLNIKASDVDAAEAEFSDADVVLTQYETSKESVIEAKRLAKKYGKPFVLNPAPFCEMPPEFYRDVDYITPNETEAEYLTGIKVKDEDTAFEAGKKLIAMGIKNVVITLGVNGAFYTDGEKRVLIKGIRVKAVETTGAGDAFNGGFVTALAEGRDVETALRFANCTAALSVTKLGSGSAMPYREEILAMMEKEYGVKLQ